MCLAVLCMCMAVLYYIIYIAYSAKLLANAHPYTHASVSIMASVWPCNNKEWMLAPMRAEVQWSTALMKREVGQDAFQKACQDKKERCKESRLHINQSETFNGAGHPSGAVLKAQAAKRHITNWNGLNQNRCLGRALVEQVPWQGSTGGTGKHRESQGAQGSTGSTGKYRCLGREA